MRPSPALALLVVLPAAAAAQTAPAATPSAATPAPHFGILGGLNSATIGGSAALLTDDDGADVSKSRRNGVAAGVYFTLPFGTSGLALRPELLFAQKGARYNASVAIPPSQGVAGTVTGRGDVRLSYVEVPLLLQFTAPTASRLRPQLYAGAAPAARLSCRFALRVSGLGQSLTESDDCENIPGVIEGDDTRLNVRRFDVGGVVGGALGFDVGGRALTVGVRYTHGLLAVFDEDGASDTKNRTLGVYGSIEFPFGRPRR